MKADINIEILNAIKRKWREDEIKSFGKLISFRTIIERNKKRYTRKRKHRSAYESEA